MKRLQSEFLDVILAAQEHFADREASEEEMQAFLRQRLIDEGKAPEEAETFLADMDGPSTWRTNHRPRRRSKPPT